MSKSRLHNPVSFLPSWEKRFEVQKIIAYQNKKEKHKNNKCGYNFQTTCTLSNGQINMNFYQISSERKLVSPNEK